MRIVWSGRPKGLLPGSSTHRVTLDDLRKRVGADAGEGKIKREFAESLCKATGEHYWLTWGRLFRARGGNRKANNVVFLCARCLCTEDYSMSPVRANEPVYEYMRVHGTLQKFGWEEGGR